MNNCRLTVFAIMTVVVLAISVYGHPQMNFQNRIHEEPSLTNIEAEEHLLEQNKNSEGETLNNETEDLVNEIFDDQLFSNEDTITTENIIDVITT